MKASFLICFFFLCVYTHVCIRNIGKIWFGYTSSEMTSYFEISFRSFLWKKETTNCYSCSSPSWWKQKWYWWWWSQIRGINQKQTKGEVIESETVVDIDESNSCESEEDEAKDSATKGRKLNAKVKGKKAYLSWSKGMKLGNLGNFFANSHALISMRKEAVQQKSYFIATQI